MSSRTDACCNLCCEYSLWLTPVLFDCGVSREPCCSPVRLFVCYVCSLASPPETSGHDEDASVVLMFFVIRLDRPSHTYNSWSRPARRTGDGGVQDGVGISWLLEVISGEELGGGGGRTTAAVGGSGGRPGLCGSKYMDGFILSGVSSFPKKLFCSFSSGPRTSTRESLALFRGEFVVPVLCFDRLPHARARSQKTSGGVS